MKKVDGPNVSIINSEAPLLYIMYNDRLFYFFCECCARQTYRDCVSVLFETLSLQDALLDQVSIVTVAIEELVSTARVPAPELVSLGEILHAGMTATTTGGGCNNGKEKVRRSREEDSNSHGQL